MMRTVLSAASAPVVVATAAAGTPWRTAHAADSVTKPSAVSETWGVTSASSGDSEPFRTPKQTHTPEDSIWRGISARLGSYSAAAGETTVSAVRSRGRSAQTVRARRHR